MKKIILLGDSIRMGYDKFVRSSLEGSAEVFYPSDNCKFTLYLLRFLRDWTKDGTLPADADVVHWNAGLWDVVELYGDGPLVSPEVYAQSLERLHRHLKMHFPKAKLIFATSTSVEEEKYGPDFSRKNKSIEEYNVIARRVLEPLGEEIDDLYSVSRRATAECRSDMTHFNTDAGRLLMGGAVVECLCKACGISPDTVKHGEISAENYSAKNIGN